MEVVVSATATAPARPTTDVQPELEALILRRVRSPECETHMQQQSLGRAGERSAGTL